MTGKEYAATLVEESALAMVLKDGIRDYQWNAVLKLVEWAFNDGKKEREDEKQ